MVLGFRLEASSWGSEGLMNLPHNIVAAMCFTNKAGKAHGSYLGIDEASCLDLSSRI